jgi:two-component system response regulator
VNAPAILLVEDNSDDEALTVRSLARAGFSERIEVVRDGAEALDYLLATGGHAHRAGAALPRLVLLDLKLPKIDGIEVLRRVRSDARTRRACVVVFTPSGEERDILDANELNANSFVRKPVAFDRFSQTVEKLARYWLNLNEPDRSRAGGNAPA